MSLWVLESGVETNGLGKRLKEGFGSGTIVVSVTDADVDMLSRGRL